MRIDHRVTAAWALIAAIAVGCGESGPTLVPVEGILTLDGKPLEEATVSFMPDPSNTEVTAGMGLTEEDGKFYARHNGRYGLAVGRYKVTFSKTAEPPPGAKIPAGMENDPLQQEFLGLRKQTLPKKYTDLQKATEVVEVKNGENNVYKFDLKTPAKNASKK